MTPTWEGRLAAIHVGDAPGAPLRSVDDALVVVGAGIDGDRYARGEGTFSGNPGGGREITLVEREALDAVARETGIALAPAETRRNLLTEGVALNHLVEREFLVGDVVLRGVRLCEPCAHLERLTHPGVREALVHRAGLRADVVAGGAIRVGDPVRPARAGARAEPARGASRA